MKKVLLSLLTITLLTSCFKNVPEKEEIPDLSWANLTQEFNVMPETDKVAIVLNGEDTLAITGITMTLDVPKGAEITVVQAASAEYPQYKNVGVSYIYHTLCFEDVFVGDDDYNDLVLYVKQEYNQDPEKGDKKAKVDLRITPIARGGLHKIKFGFESYNGETFYVIDDVDQFFRDNIGSSFDVNDLDLLAGFINTHDQQTKLFSFKTASFNNFELVSSNAEDKHKLLNFFIEGTDGIKRYVATAKHSDEHLSYQNFFTKNGRPFGISIPGKFAYPIEFRSIFKAYPDFAGWIDGNLETFTGTVKEEHLFLPQSIIEKIYVIGTDHHQSNHGNAAEGITIER